MTKANAPQGAENTDWQDGNGAPFGVETRAQLEDPENAGDAAALAKLNRTTEKVKDDIDTVIEDPLVAQVSAATNGAIKLSPDQVRTLKERMEDVITGEHVRNVLKGNDAAAVIQVLNTYLAAKLPVFPEVDHTTEADKALAKAYQDMNVGHRGT